jgi:electron transfer flavoprotein beta subunit
LIKPIPDLSKASISKSQGLLIERGAKVMKPSDRNALEFALQIHEKFPLSPAEKNKNEIVALALSGPEGEPLLKEAMALGADRAVMLADPLFREGDATTAAMSLAHACLKLEADLILAGEGQVGHRVAAEMKIPSVASAIKIESNPDGLKISVSVPPRQVELQRSIPLLVSILPGTNTPRIANAIKIMKASKKEILKWVPADIGLSSGEIGLDAAGMQTVRTFSAESG